MALRRRGLVVAGAGGVFVLSLALTPLVGTEFMPQSDSGWVNVTADVQPGRSLQFTADVANRIEDRVREEIPEVELLNSTAGSRSEEHTSELQSRGHLVCRPLL